jgi:predicted GIY-YIG superfamily endonuclease
MSRKDVVGVVYLYHFDKRYRHAGHYLGWSENFDARNERHHSNSGARLLAVISAAGIGYELTRTWEGVTRAEERRLKRRGGSARHCPHSDCKENRRRQRGTSER